MIREAKQHADQILDFLCIRSSLLFSFWNSLQIWPSLMIKWKILLDCGMRDKNSDKPFAFIILHISNLRDLSATFSPSSLIPKIHICLYELDARSKHKK